MPSDPTTKIWVRRVDPDDFEAAERRLLAASGQAAVAEAAVYRFGALLAAGRPEREAALLAVGTTSAGRGRRERVEESCTETIDGVEVTDVVVRGGGLVTSRRSFRFDGWTYTVTPREHEGLMVIRQLGQQHQGYVVYADGQVDVLYGHPSGRDIDAMRAVVARGLVALPET
jgi:hypothetical protein